MESGYSHEARIEALESKTARAAAAAATASLISVATCTALSAYGTGLQDGTRAWVQSLRTYFTFRASAANVTVDGITALTTSAGGNSRWERDTSYLDPSWRLNITDVYVDSVVGNDENVGIYSSVPGSPAPLKTMMELARRWGTGTITTGDLVNGTIQVHVLNPIAAPDRLDITVNVGQDTFVRFLGENTTILRSSNLDGVGGFVAMNPAAGGGGTANIIKDSGLASWAPYIGKRIFFVAAGSYAYVLKDLGGGSARISVPLKTDETTWNDVPAITNPANGAAYRIEDPVSVSLHRIRTSCVPGAFSISVLNVSNFTFVSEADYQQPEMTSSPQTEIVFYDCVFEVSTMVLLPQDHIVYTNCRLAAVGDSGEGFDGPLGGSAVWGGAVVDPAGGIVSLFIEGGRGDVGCLDYYCCIQHGYVLLHNNWVVGSFSVWDAAVLAGINPDGHAVMVGGAGHRTLTTGNGFFKDRAGIPIFGNGGPGVGVRISPNSCVVFESSAVPNIVGAAGEFKLATGGRARKFDEGGGIYGAPAAETWANLSGATFGGAAHNLTENCHIVQAVNT